MVIFVCQECGRKVSDALDACPHCGYPLVNKMEQGKEDFRGGALKDNEMYQPASTDEKHINKHEGRKFNVSKKLIMPTALVLVILMIVAGWYYMRTVPVEGSFSSFYGGSVIEVVEFTPSDTNENQGTYVEKFLEDGVPSDDLILTGTYEVSNRTISLTWDMLGKTTVYDREGKYLIPTEYDFSGEIPNGKRFDAICSSDGDSYQFNKDGTFLRKWDSDGEQGDEQGSYSRKGKIITLSYVDEIFERQLYIHDGNINDSTYRKD